MALELDDDEDMKFSAGASSYKENEADGSHLLPPREREFREFLVDSKAAEEIVRLLVGLAETKGELPENPVANWRVMYDAERDAFKGKENLLGPLHGPTLVTGRREENIPALLDENDALREREAKLSAELHEAVSQIHANEAAAAQVVLDAWVYGGAFVFTGPDAGLDVGKLCKRSRRLRHAPLPPAPRPSRPLTHMTTCPPSPFLCRRGRVNHVVRQVPRAAGRTSRVDRRGSSAAEGLCLNRGLAGMGARRLRVWIARAAGGCRPGHPR